MSNKNRKYKKNGGMNENAIIPIVILCAIFLPGFLGAAIPLFVFYKLLKELAGIDLVEQVKSFIGTNFGTTAHKSSDPCGDEEFHSTFSEKKGYTVRPKSQKEDPCGDEEFHGTFKEEHSTVTHSVPKSRVVPSGTVSGSYSEKKVTKKVTVSKKENPCGNEGYHSTFKQEEQPRPRRFGTRFLKNIPDGKLITLVGSIIAGVFALGAISEFIDIFPYMSLLNEDFIIPALFAVGGGVTALVGRSRTKRAALYRKLRSLIGEDATRISIRALAEAMPCSEAKADKLVQQMIDQGLLTPNAYIDGSTGYLVLDGQGLDLNDDHTAEPVRRDVQEELTTLVEIRRVNASIPDPVLTRKISRIEEITKQILDYQKKHPEKSSELRKFLNYYLPTTLRILNTYAELEEQGIRGENVNATKKRIEGMMDKVVEGFETQLDQLFAGDMMDISSDISVMEKMMSDDGLTTDFRIPKAEEPSPADRAFEQIQMTLEPEIKQQTVVSAMPVMDVPAAPVAPPIPDMPTTAEVTARSDADDMFRSLGLTLEPEKETDQPAGFGTATDGMFGVYNQSFAAARNEQSSEADAMFQSLHRSMGGENAEDWQSGFYRRTKEDLE